MLVGQLRCGVAFQRQRDFIGPHAAAVIGHFDQVQPALREAHGDVGRAGIDRVLDQFLERGGRPFDHFARGDAIDEFLWQAANCGHGP